MSVKFKILAANFGKFRIKFERKFEVKLLNLASKFNQLQLANLLVNLDKFRKSRNYLVKFSRILAANADKYGLLKR